MFGLGASPHFPEAGSWWRDPPLPLGMADSPWNVADLSAWQKHLGDQREPSPLEGEPEEDLRHVDDPELEAIKAKVREMEKEDEWLQELQAEARNLLLRSDPRRIPGLPLPGTTEEKLEADQRSIYVGNVDYGGTAEELESHFSGCGQIHRVTILCDKFSGHPKGYAYIEFADRSSVKAAMGLDETTFRGRIIKVLPKRTNMPGISSTDRGGPRGHFHGRGGQPRRAGFRGGPPARPRGRVYRGHGRLSPWYTPY
ncbi:embryonic polyadenylate-binding protein 2 [Pogona vitticeps]